MKRFLQRIAFAFLVTFAGTPAVAQLAVAVVHADGQGDSPEMP